MKTINNAIESVSDFMMKPIFIILFVFFIIFWLLWNTFTPWKVDHYPFMALNLFLSTLAGIQATVIGISQTKADKKKNMIIQKTEENSEKIILLENRLSKQLADIQAMQEKTHQKVAK